MFIYSLRQPGRQSVCCGLRVCNGVLVVCMCVRMYLCFIYACSSSLILDCLLTPLSPLVLMISTDPYLQRSKSNEREIPRQRKTLQSFSDFRLRRNPQESTKLDWKYTVQTKPTPLIPTHITEFGPRALCCTMRRQ